MLPWFLTHQTLARVSRLSPFPCPYVAYLDANPSKAVLSLISYFVCTAMELQSLLSFSGSINIY